MKEVQDPVVDVPFANPKFIDTVTQQIRKRPSQLMAEHGEPFNGSHAVLVSSLVRPSKVPQPVQDRHLSDALAIENDSCPQHLPEYQLITILLLHSLCATAKIGQTASAGRSMDG
jgi:hypothetical protein